MNNFIKKKNNNIYYILTTIIIVIFFSMIYFSDEISNLTWNTNKKPVETTKQQTNINNILNITIIDDKRCINCNTKNVIFQLKEVWSLSNAIFNTKDFSNTWAREILIKNGIKKLPAILFSNNKVEPSLVKFLEKTKDWQYLLKTGSNFNPFLKRSERWFLLIEQKELDYIKSNSYIKWNIKAKITWLEYSDLECPYCAKLHNSDVSKSLKKKYWDNLNKIFNHFPLGFHKNAEIWAEILECLWEQKWSDAFYKLIDKSFSNTNSDKDFLIEWAIEFWANEKELNKCLNSSKYSDKIKKWASIWSNLFWITWTPWNILINNETLEYSIISWAYPKEDFIKVIDRLIK